MTRNQIVTFIRQRITDPLLRQNTPRHVREVLELMTAELFNAAEDTLPSSFKPVSTTDLNPNAIQIAGLPLRAAIIALANAGTTPATGTTPAAPSDLAVNAQRVASYTPAAGTTASAYEFEFTPAAPPVTITSGSRTASITPAPGETAASFEYQFI